MEKKITVITERIDDIVLLLNVMMQMGLPTLINIYLATGSSRDWTGDGWRPSGYHILSEGTTVKSWLEWVNQRRYMLEQVWY